MAVEINFNGVGRWMIQAQMNYSQIVKFVENETSLSAKDFYLESNGKILRESVSSDCLLTCVHCRPRLLGGKGGFGSMLRAIGAQIEKTTNREACRDLSGRRLRDINEEKRVKAWLDKQNEDERQAKDRKKRKVENLLQKPKHEFKDPEYEEVRSKLTEKVHDAVEEGFQRSLQTDIPSTSSNSVSSILNPLKRKANEYKNKSVVKKRSKALWIDDYLTNTSSSESDVENESGHESDNKI